MLGDLLAQIMNALLAIPGVRIVLGLVDSRLRPIWGAALLALTAYLLARAAHFASLRRARQTLQTDHLSDPRDRPATIGTPTSRTPSGDFAIVTRTPTGETAIPLGAERTPAGSRAVASGYARTPSRQTPIPAPVSARRVSPFRLAALNPGLLAAGGAALLTIGLLTLYRTDRSPRAVVAAPDSTNVADTSFRFEDAGWRDERGTCVATIRVTAMGHSPRRLTLFVTDSAGRSIGRDILNTPEVAPGALVEFHFAKLACARVDQWQMQGEFAH